MNYESKMSTEDKSQQMDSINRQAEEVLKALSHFEFPVEVSQVENWIKATKPLQSIIKNLCEKDKSGKMRLGCVNVLYDLIATHGEDVSPAIWDLFQIVSDTEMQWVTENFLKDSTFRLKNAFCALVTGVCQCGHRIPEIQDWCYALIQGLEDKQKYLVLLSIPQTVIFKVLHGFFLPHSLKLVYPLLERILYPMVYPHVFYLIVDQIPEILLVFENENDEETKSICESFCGLIKVLMERFPPIAWKKESYQKIRNALGKFPESSYKFPSHPVWNPKPKQTTKVSSLLECPVCYERFAVPISVCENGHCLCSNCKEQLKTCPICRAQFSNIRMTILDQIMEATEFHCKNFDSGCDVKMLYKDIWDHEVDCEYRTMSCDIVTYHNPSKIVCNEDVVVAFFHKHIEKCHKSSVTNFELNAERRGELRRQRANEVRLLKNSDSNLHFIERIYVTDEEIFFSYHYIGKSVDAKNYIYTIKIDGNGIPHKIKYSNFCLPNYMGVFDTEVDERCLILEPEKIFDPQQTKFEYSVRIEEVNAYRLRIKKNKFMVSI